MICPAPLAATAGKLSVFVITKPHATQRTLKSRHIVTEGVTCTWRKNKQSYQWPQRSPYQLAHGKHGLWEVSTVAIQEIPTMPSRRLTKLFLTSGPKRAA